MEERKTPYETMLQLLSKMTDSQKQDLLDFMSKLEQNNNQKK